MQQFEPGRIAKIQGAAKPAHAIDLAGTFFQSGEEDLIESQHAADDLADSSVPGHYDMARMAVLAGRLVNRIKRARRGAVKAWREHFIFQHKQQRGEQHRDRHGNRQQFGLGRWKNAQCRCCAKQHKCKLAALRQRQTELAR